AIPADSYNRAVSLLREGRAREALPLLEAAREGHPGDPDILYHLARCYFALGRSTDGASAAEDLARRNPRDPAVLLAAGSLLLEHGVPAKSADILSGADALAPGNPLVLNSLALARWKSGDISGATASLEQLLTSLRRTLTPETRAALASASETATAI